MENIPLIGANEPFYNCSECSSPIEIININNKSIAFKCYNKKEPHKKLLTLDNYLKKITIHDIYKINGKCNENKHNKKYEIYCFECKTHLCEECLKTNEHLCHYKIHLKEIMPKEYSLNLLNKIIKNFDNKKDFRNVKNMLEIAFNTFNKCKTNYYYCININNILISYIQNNKYFKKVLSKEDNEYINEIKKQKEKIIQLNQLLVEKNKLKNLNNNNIYENKNILKGIIDIQLLNEIKEINNYNDKNFICQNHKESFIKYCLICKENLCSQCENGHKGHDIFDFNSILLKKDELSKKLEDLKNIIDKFKFKINSFVQIFNKIINIMDIYYKVNQDIFNSYNINERNYKKLENINYMKYNNENLITELNNLISKDSILELFEFCLNKFYNDNGEKYIGEIKNNIKEGRGILYYNKCDRRKKYEGYFKNGLREGKGVLYYNNGNLYKGDWKQNKREGKGIYYFKNGDKYEGDFKNGLKEGKGIMYFKNGDKYEGDWKNDKREGKGIYYFNNGDRRMGDWKNNEKIGKHVKLTKDGEVKIENF